ncbi:MAG TPA: hypothetical protein VGW37_13000, partial [Terriglobia bacterium]|nr:hypothetical protein [Terriglobia bacterium]
ETPTQVAPRPPGGMPPWGPVNFRWWNYVLAFLTIFAAAVALGRRRGFGQKAVRLWAGVAVLAMALSLGALATACNDTFVGPKTTPVTTGTPANTYKITLVGTLGSDGSIKRAATVNLAVAP